MFTHPQLRNVTGEDIAEELNEYGIAVVGAGISPEKTETFRECDIDAFVERHAISRATPFLNLRISTVFDPVLKPSEDEQTTKEIWSLGWRYAPAGEAAPGLVHKRIVSRLKCGQPVTLIRQTAQALHLDADDLQTLPLTKVERFLLNSTVRWTRLWGAPLLIGLDLQDGQRRHSRWRLSFYRHSPVNRFTPIRRRVFSSAGGSLISRLLRRAR
jgi:hypothetical protein